MSEILFIAHRIPFPPDRGDKIRSHHVLRRLAELGPVHVACFADDPDDLRHEPALAELAASHSLVRRNRPLPVAGLAALAQGLPVSLTAFADARLQSYVARVLATRPVSAIYVFSGQMGQYVPEGFGGRVVIDLVDVDSAKFEAYAAGVGGVRHWLYAREDRLLRAEEARLVGRAGLIVLVSAEEADLLRRRLPHGVDGAVTAMGNGVDTAWYDPEQVPPEPALSGTEGPRLIFTGQMDYPPNVAAAVRAATRIMPVIRQVFPAASLEIVGRRPTGAVLALDGLNGCRVRGAVADVRPWLRGADMALTPLDIARGIQNKVLEAMAMSLPVVASPGAATGIAARAGVELAVADDDAAMARAAMALIANRPAAQAMGAAARRFVEQHHAWPAVLAPLAAALGFPSSGALCDAA
ncbi:TIGR03087 family PEP-CTERM/XrtA system glycosyltransferase [Novosphingobium aerophilum]|uniref:TIGR03087 family PEP-CTERM/XrtA system glycosyltransferase n=1 Tax=Novosphingobium aerophilum TaxID=2839843 RepID=A0A7X1F5Y8_9SPHN|nr:TIGR03087 family PEP-CTERM/XrtA system glycosyltransferase [Novosphingobium aerophilum]MBC2650859.1 TIGR03087 family PEP-CTERM/XrtA system glycosyltransferase [Novosphingobium aerophilum]